jgi:DNA-binding NtrC family response regulator
MATVLIVEDDVFINMEAMFIVQELQHLVLSAHDVDQAMAFLYAGTPVDVLFTDIRLKERHLGGYELAHQASALRADLRILYASGGKHAESSLGLVLEGSHFLQKPYDERQLQVALAMALHAAPVRSPTV